MELKKFFVDDMHHRSHRLLVLTPELAWQSDILFNGGLLIISLLGLYYTVEVVPRILSPMKSVKYLYHKSEYRTKKVF